MTLPQFRPRSATEIVDAAIQLGRRHYKPLLVLSAIVAIPNLVIGLVTQWVVPPAAQAAGEFGDPADIALVFLMSIVSLLWLTIGFGALVASTAAAYVDGRALEPLAALRTALRRAVPLVMANFLAYVLTMIVVLVGVGAVFMVLAVIAGVVAAGGGASGMGAEAGAILGMVVGGAAVVCMLVAGIALWARLGINVTAAVILEGLGTFAALGRSSALVRGRVWPTTGLLLIMMVLYIAAFGTSWAVFLLVARDVNLSANVAGVLVLVLYPFLAAMLTLLYYDLRIRREGYDLELMARELDATDAPPVAGAPA